MVIALVDGKVVVWLDFDGFLRDFSGKEMYK
jgi:hypothetical protein